MKTKRRLTRRDVLKCATGAALGAPLFVPAAALGLNGHAPASERITLAAIGVGPRCTYDLRGMLPLEDVRCVAVCDVQADRLTAAKRLVDGHYHNEDCRTYTDFREVLDRRDINAVLIATGDHWHAPASILAARAGKDIYSEKPCGLTIKWCQDLDDAVRQNRRVFQAGTQRRSVANFQAAVRLAQTGRLGRLRTLHATSYIPSVRNDWLPAQLTPARNVVDWDRWLGPAPWRPYNHNYVEGQWRGYWDFDSGCRLLDWGAHTVDLCQWANQSDNTMPIEYVPGEGTITCRYANGVELVVNFLANPFGNTTGRLQTLGTCSVRFEGADGWVEAGDSGRIEVNPASLREGLNLGTTGSGLDVRAHAQNFFDCVRSRARPAANSEVMRRSHIACHAAALAWLLRRRLRLNPEREEFIDDAEANGLRSLPSRNVL